MAEPTPYADVNRVLGLLLARVHEVLGDELIGLYVYGSLATGDFTPGRSDIDFVAATATEVPDTMLPALGAMHAEITRLGQDDSALAWAAKLEGPYISLKALRRHDPANARHPALRVDGSFGVDGHGSDWIIQRYVIREYGITVAGPPPNTLIDPVLPDDLRRAAAGILREWWAPMLERPARLRSSEYQAYAVLTMCRSLYTVQRGDVVGKAVAARWAQEWVDARWTALIDRALAWRHGTVMDELDAVKDLIRYTLDLISRMP